ncbi:MAG TPA: asparagine synthase (glutamine-hydrolyzing), partial [Candidatus Limnocylindria bacterium]|nr:asparagine synthase (glutamine-hydrolyzing) [Candidatus Limnocylindria bacterium]
MCGLAGYINLTRAEFCADDSLLQAMQATIAHRGPDGFRTWISPQHHLALVHRRLSIVDLSDAGFQPMFDQDRTVAVCCNGEIYNHPALRRELEALGHSYSSHSDTETIVYAYKQWGIDFIHRLSGMFVIVLFDIQRNELYIIRDRFGIKPLYFSLQGGVLSFASEIKALWPLPWIAKNLNTTAFYHYLTYLVTPAPMTLYQGVYKLPAGQYLKLDAQRALTFHEWYNPMAAIAGQPMITDEDEAVATLRVLLRNSIQSHMMSDVPYGVFLSGGIDSSLNVALMSEFTDRVKTFNVSFSDGPEYSEVAWARKVAQQFNTDHHEIVISEKDAFAFFHDMVHYQDEPIADCVCIPLYYV